MRRVASWILAAPLLTLLNGCEVPVRDNARDPVNAPVASLQVVDLGLPVAGVCPVIAGDTPYPGVVSISRGHCLALDARGSSSPKEHTLEITFTIHDTAGNLLAEPPRFVALPDSPQEFALLDDFRRTLPFGKVLTAEVFVEDKALDTTVTASASFELLNSPPILVVDRPRTLPLGGYGWALGTDFVVPFGIAGSTDADGDPLYLEVSVDGAPPVLVGPLGAPLTAPVVTPSIPADERGSFVVEMRIFDGPAEDPRIEGRPERAVVRVREPNPWMHLGGDTGAVARIDGTSRDWMNPPILIYGGAINPSGFGGVTRRNDAPMLVVRGPDPKLRAKSWPDGQQSGEDFTLAGGAGTEFSAAIVVGENGEIWRVGGLAPSFQKLHVDSAATISSVAQSTGSYFGGSELFHAVVTTNGNVWTAEQGDESYVYAEAIGAVVSPTRFPLPGRRVLELSRRPETDEIWMLDEDLFVGDPRLRRIAPDGSIAETWPIASDTATALAWAGADSFWLAHGELGLVRIDARLLDAGITTLEAAVLNQFPLFGLFDIVADKDTGTAWTHSKILDTSWRADTNGRLDVIGIAHTFFDVDPDGAALFAVQRPSATTVAGRATSTLAGGRDRTMHFAASAAGASDATNGGAWIYRSSGDIVHVDEEGTIIEQRRFMSLPGGPELLPPLASFRPSPDGSHAWAIELSAVNGGRVFHMDLRAEPMPTTVALADAAAIGPAVVGVFPVLLGRPRYPILEPSSPDGSTAWIVRLHNGTPATAAVFVLSPDGTLTPLPSAAGDIPEVGPGGVLVRAAVTQKTNTLCLAAHDGPTNQLRVRRLHLDGTVEVFVTNELPLFDPGRLIAVATSSTETQDFCWVTWKSGEYGPFEVRAYADAGAVPERSLTGASALIKPLGLLPFRDETLWLSTQGDLPTFDNDAFVTRYDFLPAGGMQESRLGVLRESAPPDGPVFLSPAAPLQRYQP